MKRHCPTEIRTPGGRPVARLNVPKCIHRSMQEREMVPTVVHIVKTPNLDLHNEEILKYRSVKIFRYFKYISQMFIELQSSELH